MKRILVAACALLVAEACSSTKVASYHYTQKQIEKGDLSFDTRLNVGEYVNAFPQEELARPKKGDLEVRIDYISQSNPGTTLAQIAVRTRAVSAAEKARRMGIVVVLDVSGSMDDDGKLKSAIAGLTAMVSELPDRTQFALVKFSTSASVEIPPTVVDRSNRDALKKKIQALDAGGGTDIQEGLVLGYKTLASFEKGQTSRLLLLTDGMSNVGVTDPKEISAKAGVQYLEGLRISTIGLGHDVDEGLLRMIATKGNGAYYFAESGLALKALFLRDLQSLMVPIAKDVAVTITGNKRIFLRQVYGAGPITGNWFKDQVGELNVDDWRIYIAEVQGEGDARLDASVSYVDSAGKRQTASAWRALPIGVTKPNVNHVVARNAVIFANALTLIQVGKLAKQAEYKDADSILTIQRANLETVRKWDTSPELAREAESLAKVQGIVRAYLEEQRSADAKAQAKVEKTSSEGGSIFRSALDVVEKALPGPWSTVFGLLRLVTDR